MHHHHHHRPHIPSHRPHVPSHRPHYPSHGGGSGNPLGVVLFGVLIFIGLGALGLYQKAQFDRRVERSRSEFERERKRTEAEFQHNWNDNPLGGPAWHHETEEERQARLAREAEFQRNQAELLHQLDGEMETVQTFREPEHYQEAVALAVRLTQNYTNEANAYGLNDELRRVRTAAIRATFTLAKKKVQPLIREDRYQDAVAVMETLRADVEEASRYVDLENELTRMIEGYRFVADLAAVSQEP